MNAITQAILNKSKLEIELIKITNATHSSFVMSLKGKATKIGVATAIISEMTVDLVGPQGAFGRLNVPSIKMGSLGATITIVDQLINIIDMGAFQAFVAAIMKEEDLTLRLENGHATVKAMGMKSIIVYHKVLHLKGLKSLQSTLVKEEVGTDGVRSSTISLMNPSQFEVDLGTVVYEVQDKNGKRIGEQKGATYVPRGASSLALCGAVTGEVLGGETRFVGVDVEEENWIKQIMRSIEVVVTV
ncbi:hypothetical protein ISF_07063 [Cordyceps fumosorosea ARSEF 2679]|uniref:Uncharacterized protein n=1 Tax=Cordyceps fumosorosea (strain ARSEF 2679) TaxID=1081104 RepID=A0A167QP84_CORFA|nr:hypothetical protein ISF_07063 [Cordyceps fumosorosea ARSEF 2679]OAA57822.1 hypothetical protein ISF_07063 [Cordyceps fumosorosea ARSEF 2679]